MSFKMKGTTLYGKSPMKQGSNIPSFRDFVSLEQQQSYADKLDKRRADEREYKEEIEGTLDTEGKSLKRNIFGKLTGDFFGGRRSRERADLIEELKNKEETAPEEEIIEENVVEDDIIDDAYIGGDEKNLVNIENPSTQQIWSDPDYYKNMSNVQENVEETVETTPYEVQGGDTLGEIAKANNMTLEELLEKNPEYKENPSFVRKGATLNL